MNRRNFSTGAKWEDIVGYCRAVQVGYIIEIAGTTAVIDGIIVHKGDAYLQTKAIIEIAKSVLEEAGGDLSNVIRTRIYVTDISKWRDIGKAHGEFYRTIKPATSMVEVSGLVDPDMLVEIEFTAHL